MVEAGGSGGSGVGEIIAVGTRPRRRPGGARRAAAARRADDALDVDAHSIDDIEKELARIWAQPNLMLEGDGGERPAAGTSPRGPR